MEADARTSHGIAPDLFRSVMRSFSSSVCVITSAWDGQHFGMTATAVCSVSAEPPRVLIVVNRQNRSHASITKGRAFTINLLSSAQQHLAQHFSSRPGDPFRDVPHGIGQNGCPVLDGCEAVLECVVGRAFDEGTHTIVVGEVEHAASRARSVLIYHQGNYREIA